MADGRTARGGQEFTVSDTGKGFQKGPESNSMKSVGSCNISHMQEKKKTEIEMEI